MTFQRGETTGGHQPLDAPSRRGAGVGLAVCRSIAHAHGGELRLHARQGGGASFELLLPLLASPAAAGESLLGTTTT
jgi:two-component system sensor histidine kinase KdpD